MSNTTSGFEDIPIELEVPAPAVAEPTSTGSRIRSVGAGILGVLTILVLVMATVAVWALATVFNEDKVADIVNEALAEPEVETALAEWVTERLFMAVDVDEVVTDVLPANLQRLEPTIVAGAQSFVERGLTRVFAEPTVQDVIGDLVIRAHRRAMDLLQGDGVIGGISVENGEVSLNTLPLVALAFTELQKLGLFSDVEIPEMSANGDPAEQIAALEEATGRDLSDSFGQLVVYQSDALADAQASVQNARDALTFAKRAAWLLVVMTVVLAVATLITARRRWRAVLWLGLGAIAAMVIVRAATQRVVDDAPDLAARPPGRAAIAAILGESTAGLLRLTGVTMIVAVCAAVLALLKRQWNRDDLILVAAVVLAAAVVAVGGFSAGTLIVAIAVVIGVPLAANRWLAPHGDLTPEPG